VDSNGKPQDQAFHVGPDLLILVVLALDCAIRYSQVLRGEELPDGFLEWLFRFGRSGSPPPG